MQSGQALRHACVQKAAVARPIKQARVAVVSNAFTARPYTVRKGDSLTLIAQKRGFEVSELTKLNYGIDPDNLAEGQTLLLPAGSLSTRDKEILQGVGKGSYRTYPVRKGENITDILGKRNITLKEFQVLNPDIDADRLVDNLDGKLDSQAAVLGAEHQILKLPSNKFTVREREMMTGTGIVPSEFFDPYNVKIFGAGLAAGVVAYAAVSWAINKFKDE